MNDHTPISSIGEFGLIDRIRKIVDGRDRDLLMGIGDDAAVYRPSPDALQLLATDTLVEGVHFDLTFTSLKHLGWKSLVASLSDIAAMGGVPRYALVALSLPAKFSVEMVEEFYAGAAFAAREHHCLIVGGDTTASSGNTVVTVSMVGEVREQQIRYRRGAAAGELLCVSGHLGASLAGLKVLQREKLRAASSPTHQPDLAPYTAALEKHLMPKPRLDLAKLFAEVAVSAVIDISDGLASEVHHLCRSGTVGATVYEHNLPLISVTQAIAAEFHESPTQYALYGGEEYELLFTMSDKEFATLESLTGDVTIIGRVEADPGEITLIRENGEREPLRASGWDHFGRPAC
jgi:thiamine-monophosphate kinase